MGQEPKEVTRVIAYVDGYNFYFGLSAKYRGRFKWLDYRALFERRVRSGQALTAVKLFTALVEDDAGKRRRHQAYLKALRAHAAVDVIQGSYVRRDVQCEHCGQQHRRKQEKGTDVAMAVEMLTDAYEGRVDLAFLVTADADLVPAVRHVQGLSVKVALIDPPRRHSDELAEVADYHWNVSRSHLNQSQLPNPVEVKSSTGRVRSRIWRPDGW